MSSKKITCSNLDNTSVLPRKDNLLGNQNTKGGDKIIGDDNSQNYDDKVDNSGGEEEENDFNEYDTNIMTGSYGEISYFQDESTVKDERTTKNKNSQSCEKTSEEKLQSSEGEEHAINDSKLNTLAQENKRPNSLGLKNSITAEAATKVVGGESLEPWKKIHRSQQTSDSQTTSINGSPSFSSEEFAIYSPSHQRTGSDASGLSDLQGTITVEGDMVSFVAEDLQEKIRLSSPVSKWIESPSYAGSHSSTPSLYKQALQPHIPIVDAGAIADLEVHARKVASCVDTMLENLSGTLQSISSLTVDYMETYESAVCKTCDSVDISIKTMYQLIAKCEELSNTVKPMYKISQDIKEIKKALSHFENTVEHKPFGRI